MENNIQPPFKLIWIDCEMTGLDIERDTLLEVGCIITDSDLNVVSEGPNIIINQPKEVLEQMNDWCQKMHRKTGLYQASLESRCSVIDAEQQLLKFVRKHTEKGKCYIAGNSVYMDVFFLRKFMPQLINHTHYRLLDISSLKILSEFWYGCSYNKKSVHRSLSDIKESIEELKFFREHIFKHFNKNTNLNGK